VCSSDLYSEREAAYARQVAEAVARAGRGVRQLGFLTEEELNDLLAASDVVLLPYSSGTASGILARALAQGRPVLASDLEFFREIRSERPCLELFRSGDAGDLAERLTKILPDAPLRRGLSRQARLWAQAHSWRAVARATADLYAEILHNGMKSRKKSAKLAGISPRP
jgi:glycosyltransferase involved in cell wall biosynthesis